MSTAPAHVGVCTSNPRCLELQSAAVVALDFNAISRSELWALCASANLNQPVGISKAALATRLVITARDIVDGIHADSCRDALSLFRSRVGKLSRFLLRSSSRRTDEYLDVPWSVQEVRVQNLLSVADKLTHKQLIAALKDVVPGVKISREQKDKKEPCIVALVQQLELALADLDALTERELATAFVSHKGLAPPPGLPRRDVLVAILDCMWPEDVLVTLMVASCDDTRVDTKSFRVARERQRAVLQSYRNRLRNANIVIHWPPDISKFHRISCMSAYFKASQFAAPATCACCGQRRIDIRLLTYVVDEDMDVDLDVLQCADEWLLDHPCQPFTFPDPRLDGLVLDNRGLRFAADVTYMDLCPECCSSLRSSRRPRLSLRNGLYRGFLPEEFRDLSWVEEQICAINVVTCRIFRLHGSTNPENPFVLYGNTCAHPLNVMETAKLLPRAPSDINGRLGIIFVGPKKYKPKALGEVFRVRRFKIMAFLRWLVANNRLYSRMPIDPAVFDQYPVDGPLPGVDSRIVHRDLDDPEASFARETAGLDDHPALATRRLAENEDFVFMEALGLTDPESLTVNARTFNAAALSNLLPQSMRVPDLTFHRGSQPVPEYGNRDLFPSLFPTLYPFGIGGFEDWEAQAETQHVAFQTHANYLLNLADRSFSAHRSFMFVVINIIQRRTVHTQTSFRTRSSYINDISPDLLRVTPEQIKRVSEHLQAGRSYASVSNEDSNVLNLLRVVEAVAAKVPGTHGAKLELRRSIFGYARHISIPQVFFTMNPNPVHNPLFHLMCGDVTVDLAERYPKVADAIQRSLRVAADPAAVADFFDLSIKLILEHLFGWDFEKKRSKPGGGILGELAAFTISVELTGRGVPHGHVLIWLKGAPNPRQVRERLKADGDFQDRFFRFWDGAIHHHLPTGFADVRSASRKYDPREERPPEPPSFDSSVSTRALNGDLTADEMRAVEEWEDVFLSEIKHVGEKTQRHEHKDVCYAYGHKDCRFLFPHTVEPKSFYDAASNSIVMRALESDVNYFNPDILVMTRCNHDMKCILSGGDTQAAIYYITGYITKLDINDHYLLSLMTEAVESLQTYAVDPSLRTMLHKCMARITRSLQMHAQQAVRYIRGRKDYILSHDTVPMMSAVLMKHVTDIYRVSELGVRTDSADDELDAIRNGEVECADDEESDPSFLVHLDADGNLRYTNQVEDYMYRPDQFRHLGFYDFVSLFRCVKKSRAGRSSYPLNPPHSLAETHVLEYRHALGEDDERVEYIPVMVGTKVLRRADSDYYRLFCLAHFKPFSVSEPIVPPGRNIRDCYASYTFSAEAQARIQNWEDLFECEDQRDADRLRMQASKSRNKVREDAGVGDDVNQSFDIDPQVPGTVPEDALRYYVSLEGAGWFKSAIQPAQPDAVQPLVKDDLPQTMLKNLWKTWHKEMKLSQHSSESPLPVVGSVTDATVSIEPTSSAENATTVLTATGPVPKFTSEFALQFALTYNLNPEQARAYRIIVDWLHAYTHSSGSVSSPRPAPLRMLLHGAGGTGKTYSLKPLTDVLLAVQFPEAIARLAPTGSAASLIDGSTVHSAIKLQVRNEQGSSYRSFEVSWSAADRKHLQELFGSAVLVLLDEFSLASTKMLGQIDVALRVARQNWSEPFGGMSVVLCGDLCQYEPAMGSALWTPLSSQRSSSAKGDDDSLDRLGRIAYKTFDTIIEFTRQERMKEDPAFAAAVNRLRMRQCIPADVHLFNTRVVKSDTNPTGVDLDDPAWAEATTVVTKNDVRRVINAKKARSYGAASGRFFDIAADDRLSVKDGKVAVTSSIRSQVLATKLKVKRGKAGKPTDILPGRLTMYEGMPVMLRKKNISVYLKATNGAQGILRGLSVSTDEYGETVARLALVEIPGSPARLTGLPPGVVPLAPLTCTFPVCIATRRDGKDCNVWATAHRKQLAVEGAFCITGHSAQGKTLVKVICCPACRCGFYIYVTFSRPRRLDCLALLGEVTLEMLNEPLDRDLRFELRRVATLAHNTAVRAGDLNEPLVPVPVHERERDIPDRATISAVQVPDARPRKRTREDAPDEEPEDDDGRNIEYQQQTRKRPRFGVSAASRRADDPPKTATRRRNRTIASRKLTPPSTVPSCPFAGPVWDSDDWSCAYDAAFVAMLSSCTALGSSERTRWSAQSSIAREMSDAYTVLMRPVHLTNPGSFVHYRNVLRHSLHRYNPLEFPLRGHVLADVNAVLRRLVHEDDSCLDVVYEVRLQCDVCRTDRVGDIYLLPAVSGADGGDSVHTNNWFGQTVVHEALRTLPVCCDRAACSIVSTTAPPLLHLVVDPRATVVPSLELLFTGVRYRLAAVVAITGDVVQSASCHFRCFAIVGSSVFSYDGISPGGRLDYAGDSAASDLTSIDGARACGFLYAIDRMPLSA